MSAVNLMDALFYKNNMLIQCVFRDNREFVICMLYRATDY